MLGAAASSSPDWVFLILGVIGVVIGIARLRSPGRIGLAEMDRHRRLGQRVPWLYALPGMKWMQQERPATAAAVWAGLVFLVGGIGALIRGVVGLLR